MFKGIDVSEHQGTVNFDMVKSTGIEVIILRTTYGTGYNDIKFEEYYNACNGKFNLGTYHYFRPGQNPEEQARKAWSRIQGKEFNCLHFVDVEEGNNCNDLVIRYINEYEKLSGQTCGIYANSNYLCNYLNSGILGNRPVWVANYGKNNGTKCVNNPSIGAFTNMVGHQYTSVARISGITENTVDMNEFYDGILRANPVNVVASNTANVSSTVSPHDYLQTEFKRKLVQHILNALGYNLTVDGIIGTKSVAAIKDYQSKKGLVIDGLVGKNTFRAFMGDMQGITCFKSNIRTNPNRVVQHMLSCTADGIFGSITETAVRNFQSRSGIGVDGIVGPVTWSRLFGAYI